jgi:hypothetical protein
MKIEWKTLIIGVIAALILAYIIPLFAGLGEIGAFIGFVIATVYVGYAVGADFKNGALNGMLVGIIISIISEIQVLTYNGAFLVGLTNEMISYLVYVVIFYAIAGSITGFIGSLIKRSRTPKGNITSD